MRYKTFMIVSHDVDYDIYSEDTPTLGEIEIKRIIVSSTKPKVSSSFAPLQVVVDENHPYFNFDIWADEIDWLDNDDYIPYNSQLFRGAGEVNDIIAEYFPSVIEYYKHQI